MTNQLFCHQRDWNRWNGLENRVIFVGRPTDPDLRVGGGERMVEDVFGNNLALWSEALQMAKRKSEKKELEGRIKNGQAYLDKINKNLETPSDLEDGLHEWHRLSRLVVGLKSKDFETLPLAQILDPDSDYSAFLDPQTHSDFSAFLNPQPDSKMGIGQKRVRIGDVLRQKVAGPFGGQEGAPRTRYLDMTSIAALDRIRELAKQAMNILQDRMAERVEKKVAEVETETNAILAKHRLKKKTVDGTKTTISAVRATIDKNITHFDWKKLSPDMAVQALKANVDQWEKKGNRSVRNIRAYAHKLDAFAQDKQAKFDGLNKIRTVGKRYLGKITASLDSATAAIEADKKRPKIAGDRSVREWRNTDGMKLVDYCANNPGLGEELTDPSQLSDEDAMELADEGKPMVETLEGLEKSRICREAMEAIASANSAQEALDKLTQSVGPEHVTYIHSSVEFNKKYGIHTDGYMVFGLKGDKWRIIVDEEKVKNLIDDDGSELKRQITHELRHLEFEGNPRINESWKTAFLEKTDKADWEKIQKAYCIRFYDKAPPHRGAQTTPFVPKDWEPMDMLSELYAMWPDLSELPQVAPLIRKGARLAEFASDVDIQRKWEDKFLIKESKWAKIRKALVKAHPNMAGWGRRDLLAELYASQENGGWNTPPELALALAGMGLNQWLAKDSEAGADEGVAEEKASKAETKEKILGSVGGGGKEEDKDEENKPKTRIELESDLESIFKSISSFEKSPSIGQVPGGLAFLSGVKHYAELQKGQLARAEGDDGLEPIQKNIKRIQDGLNGADGSIESELNSISEKQTNTISNPLLTLWKNTDVYSLGDFIAVGEHFVDYIQRWSKLRTGVHQGRLAKLIFDGSVEGMVLEGSEKESGAWKTTVTEWADRFKTKDKKKLLGYLHDMAEGFGYDKPMFCAIVSVMCERGIMDWVNKDLWIILNRMQTGANSTYFDVNDTRLSENETYLHDKLRIAFAHPVVFNKLSAFDDKNAENNSAYEDKKKKFEPEITGATRLIGSKLKKMLVAFKDTKAKKGGAHVEATRYEMMLEVAIREGTYEPMETMFYLLSGMACGLLKPNTGVRLTKMFNRYPVLEYFNTKASEFCTREKIEGFVKESFGDDYKNNKVGSKFKSFYWTEMVNDARVLSRITKSVENGGKEWDHDWSQSFAMCGDASVAKTILKGSSSSPTTVKTQPPNIYAGLLQWFEENSKPGSKEPSKKMLLDRISYYFMFESILSGAAYANSSDKASFFRGTEIASQKGSPPREAGQTNHPDMKLGEIEDNLNGMMGKIDPRLGNLFKVAIDKESSAEDAGHLTRIRASLQAALPGQGSWITSNILKPDDFYSNINTIVQMVLADRPAESIISALRGAFH